MHILCRSKLVFAQKLHELSGGKIGLNATAFVPFMGFVDEKGEVVHCQHAVVLVEEFNKRYGKVLGDGTRNAGGRAVILLDVLDQPEVVVKEKPAPKKPKAPKKAKAKEEAKTEDAPSE